MFPDRWINLSPKLLAKWFTMLMYNVNYDPWDADTMNELIDFVDTLQSDREGEIIAITVHEKYDIENRDNLIRTTDDHIFS